MKISQSQKDEYHVCREGVGLMDMSSFAKFIIRGEEKSLINYLQMLCSNDVDVPVGSCVSTGMQNEKGGYENDCLLIRKREDAFFMVSPTQQQTRILEWMDNHLPEDNSISLQVKFPSFLAIYWIIFLYLFVCDYVEIIGCFSHSIGRS